LREHFQGIPLAFPKHLALPTISKIFYVCKLVFPDGIKIFEVHAERIVFDENPDIIPLA